MSQTADVVAILLPQAGNSMEEGTILRWRVKPGDTVNPGDLLYDLETDKATIEVEAEQGGRLARIVVPAGQTVAVKTPIAYLSEDDAAVDLYLQKASVVATASAVVIPTPAIQGQIASLPISRRKASPVARKAAGAHGVDIDSIPHGSGPDGRVLLEDVERFVAARHPVGEAPRHRASGTTRTPISKMRKAIGKNLCLSKQTLPHWYTKVTIDAEPLLAYAKREKAIYPCSLNDVIVWAVGRVVMELPLFRTQIDGDDLVEFPSANIGLAVGLDSGLVVPVVKSVDTMNLKGVAGETRRVIEAAKNGRLEGVGEGVFTISNLGMHGVEEFVAIINPPESGILSVGAVREEVVVKNGAMKPGKVMTMVLSADHRLIDGTMAAKFVGRLKEILEGLS